MYSGEFKLEAVRIANEPGVTVQQIGTELGVNPHLPGKWRRQLQEDGEILVFHGRGKPRAEEMAALERELARVRKERDPFAGSGGVPHESAEMKSRMIERCRDAFPVHLMCSCLKVSSSGYYVWRDRPLRDGAKDNLTLLDRIRAHHAE